MGVIERVSDCGDDLEYLGFRHPGWVPAAQQLGGVGSLDIVHRQPQLSLELAAVVDADNVGNSAARSASRLNRCRYSWSAVRAAGRTLRASRRGSRGCWARYTSPIPPDPNRRTIVYPANTSPWFSGMPACYKGAG